MPDDEGDSSFSDSSTARLADLSFSSTEPLLGSISNIEDDTTHSHYTNSDSLTRELLGLDLNTNFSIDSRIDSNPLPSQQNPGTVTPPLNSSRNPRFSILPNNPFTVITNPDSHGVISGTPNEIRRTVLAEFDNDLRDLFALETSPYYSSDCDSPDRTPIARVGTNSSHLSILTSASNGSGNITVSASSRRLADLSAAPSSTPTPSFAPALSLVPPLAQSLGPSFGPVPASAPASTQSFPSSVHSSTTKKRTRRSSTFSNLNFSFMQPQAARHSIQGNQNHANTMASSSNNSTTGQQKLAAGVLASAFEGNNSKPSSSSSSSSSFSSSLSSSSSSVSATSSSTVSLFSRQHHNQQQQLPQQRPKTLNYSRSFSHLYATAAMTTSIPVPTAVSSDRPLTHPAPRSLRKNASIPNMRLSSPGSSPVSSISSRPPSPKKYQQSKPAAAVNQVPYTKRRPTPLNLDALSFVEDSFGLSRSATNSKTAFSDSLTPVGPAIATSGSDDEPPFFSAAAVTVASSGAPYAKPYPSAGIPTSVTSVSGGHLASTTSGFNTHHHHNHFTNQQQHHYTHINNYMSTLSPVPLGPVMAASSARIESPSPTLSSSDESFHEAIQSPSMLEHPTFSANASAPIQGQTTTPAPRKLPKSASYLDLKASKSSLSPTGNSFRSLASASTSAFVPAETIRHHPHGPSHGISPSRSIPVGLLAPTITGVSVVSSVSTVSTVSSTASSASSSSSSDARTLHTKRSSLQLFTDRIKDRSSDDTDSQSLETSNNPRHRLSLRKRNSKSFQTSPPTPALQPVSLKQTIKESSRFFHRKTERTKSSKPKSASSSPNESSTDNPLLESTESSRRLSTASSSPTTSYTTTTLEKRPSLSHMSSNFSSKIRSSRLSSISLFSSEKEGGPSGMGSGSSNAGQSGGGSTGSSITPPRRHRHKKSQSTSSPNWFSQALPTSSPSTTSLTPIRTSPSTHDLSLLRRASSASSSSASITSLGAANPNNSSVTLGGTGSSVTHSSTNSGSLSARQQHTQLSSRAHPTPTWEFVRVPENAGLDMPDFDNTFLSFLPSSPFSATFSGSISETSTRTPPPPFSSSSSFSENKTLAAPIWFLRQVVSSNSQPVGLSLSAHLFLPRSMWSSLDASIGARLLDSRIECLHEATRIGTLLFGDDSSPAVAASSETLSRQTLQLSALEQEFHVAFIEPLSSVLQHDITTAPSTPGPSPISSSSSSSTSSASSSVSITSSASSATSLQTSPPKQTYLSLSRRNSASTNTSTSPYAPHIYAHSLGFGLGHHGYTGNSATSAYNALYSDKLAALGANKSTATVGAGTSAVSPTPQSGAHVRALSPSSTSFLRHSSVTTLLAGPDSPAEPAPSKIPVGSAHKKHSQGSGSNGSVGTTNRLRKRGPGSSSSNIGNVISSSVSSNNLASMPMKTTLSSGSTSPTSSSKSSEKIVTPTPSTTTTLQSYIAAITDLIAILEPLASSSSSSDDFSEHQSLDPNADKHAQGVHAFCVFVAKVVCRLILKDVQSLVDLHQSQIRDWILS
ncbi:uncharacterized protein SAPINGB_P006073 [Magnusiomyces paraingens]|uniref:Uncharacterized protein n=1 Tax=Magnusiomyces paraingens TaxID=2606893 RepID=A0A5E8C4A1_9ASCO|nr:uncharacterized protein SAPINGB_P006073 [Saprochaete ingens]VVT58172.1 unnamed protein product [Saprochaete ingens]